MIEKILKKMLERDILVKTAAVLLALLTWATVYSENNPMISKQYVVAVKAEVPSGKTADLKGADKVTVTLRGRTRVLAQITPEKLAALSAVADGSVATQGRISNVPVSFVPPFGLELLDVTPNTVPVLVDTPMDKQVGINIITRGLPNQDYEADKPVTSVATVKVSGPSSQLDKVQVAWGEIDVTGAVEAVNRTVALIPRDASNNEVTGVTVTPAEVDVTVPLKSLGPSKVVPVRIEWAGVPLAGFRINTEKTSTTPTTVKIRGDASALRSISAISTRSVDLTGRSASFSTTANLAVPQGVTVEGGTTKVTVGVNIEEDIINKTFDNIPVVPENVPVDCSWDIEPSKVSITLTGRSDVLAGIKASDLQAYIDASGVAVFDPASSSPPPRVQVFTRGTEGLKVDVKPGLVTLTLTKR